MLIPVDTWNFDKMAKFGRYNLIEIQGLPDDTIICAEKKNLVFATGLQTDINDISLVDERCSGRIPLRHSLGFSRGTGGACHLGQG